MLSNGSTRLTVVMSVKNGEPYVAEAVQSILDQTYRDFRFIIVDNASTDSTRDTIQNFNDPRIDLICLPQDVGQTRALNLGLDRVQTEYVARMDADDVALPIRFAVQVAFLDTHPDVVAVGAAAQMIDWNGKDLFAIRYPSDNELILDYMVLGTPLIHPVVTMRTNVVRAVGGYSGVLTYAQDMGLWIEMAQLGALANLPQVLVRARLHGKQQTRDRALRMRRMKDALELCRRMKNLPDRSPGFLATVALRELYLRYRIGERVELFSSLKALLREDSVNLICSRVFWSILPYLVVSWYRKARVRFRILNEGNQ